MPPEPLVSIIIPSYNRRHFLGDAIDSCLAQTHSNCEIIVIDDGSEDGSGGFLRERYGERIRYLHQRNRGPGSARNRGIAAANGDFIQFLDADDQLAAEKISRCLGLFQDEPEIAVVHTWHQLVAADGKTAMATTPFPQFSDDIFCEMLRLPHNGILLSATMARAAALRDVGGFDEDAAFRSSEDWDLFLRLAARYKFRGIEEPLVYRRMHADMLSHDSMAGALGRLKTVQKARHYGWEGCMSAGEFDRLEAARHHVVATRLWQRNQRRRARHHFLRAAAIHAPLAPQRRLFALYALCLPPAALIWSVKLSRWLRRLAGRKSGREP